MRQMKCIAVSLVSEEKNKQTSKQTNNQTKTNQKSLKNEKKSVAETNKWICVTCAHNPDACNTKLIMFFEVSPRDPDGKPSWRASSSLSHPAGVLPPVTHSSLTLAPMGRGNRKTRTQPIEKLDWVQELCTGRRTGECEKDFPILNGSLEACARNEQ